MRMPPYDEPDWSDALHVVLGVVVLLAVLGLAVWMANSTGVAR